MSDWLGPFPIEAAHETDTFDCGDEALNAYLKRFAAFNEANRSARTFVVLAGTRVVGFFSLAAGSLEHAEAPERVGKGLARHPIPIILLGRLAIDKSAQGQGLGRALFKEALKRSLAASEQVGARAVVVHAKTNRAAETYRNWGMIPFPAQPLILYVLMSEIERRMRR